MTTEATSRNQLSEAATAARATCIGLLVCATMLLVTATSVRAQSGNQSDATSVTVTTSDGISGALLGGPGVEAGFSSAAVQQRVNRAAQLLSRELAGGTFLIVPLASNAPVPANAVTAQKMFTCLLAHAEGVASCASSIASALAADGVDRSTANDLVSSLDGLMRDGQVEPTQFAASVHHFNQFVMEVPESYLASPPHEFMIIHSVLAHLIGAANAVE